MIHVSEFLSRGDRWTVGVALPGSPTSAMLPCRRRPVCPCPQARRTPKFPPHATTLAIGPGFPLLLDSGTLLI